MRTWRRALAAMLLMGGAAALAQSERRDPHIGYVYPAGGRQGTTFRVTIGGQNLRGVTNVFVSGAGVHGKVIQFYPPMRNISSEERELLSRTMRELMAKRWGELQKAGKVGPLPPRLKPPERAKEAAKDEATSQPVELPSNPLFYDLEHKSIRELLNVRAMLMAMRKGQRNAQLAESVLIEVKIEPSAPPGERELRLDGAQGLTNPMVFEVGTLPEINELEDDESRVAELLPPEPALQLPVVLNGQIMTGDVDRFEFRAREGQGLVIETHARRLIPYLADAVPGWFQAAVTLRDEAGDEVAFADDYRFDPDPVLYYKVPADGEYELEIRDSLYRGREDFVYRVTVSEQPFITSLFPLGVHAGSPRYVEIGGWNLTTERLYLDPGRDTEGIRQKVLGIGKRLSNRVVFAIDALPADIEHEPNDAPADAQRIVLPHVVDGRIGAPGDVDYYQFKGKAGEEVVAEIMARRLNSPMDGLLRLLDADGNVVAWNDDYEHKDGFLHMDTGVQTHSADSYLRAKLPADGTYFVQVTDTQGQGGPAYAYRLRVSPPQPDFALRVTPSSVNIGRSGAGLITAYALRKDGFDGEIEVFLEGAPRGFELSGAVIPAGQDRARMILIAPAKSPDHPVEVRLAGRARIGKQVVKHSAVPADDEMQAFLYRHLTPAQETLVAVRGKRAPAADMRVAGATPVRIQPGGTAEVRLDLPPRAAAGEWTLQLNEPPAGISLGKVTKTGDGVVLVLKADAQAAKPGTSENLIIEAFAEVMRPQQGKAASKPATKTRVSAGFLPAVPIVIAGS